MNKSDASTALPQKQPLTLQYPDRTYSRDIRSEYSSIVDLSAKDVVILT